MYMYIHICSIYIYILARVQPSGLTALRTQFISIAMTAQREHGSRVLAVS